MRAVVCIVGPTGTGKSAAAIELAVRTGGVIINMDSRQVYRDFPVITAQPTAEDRTLAPHRLYGFLDMKTPCTAGLWIEKAREVLDGDRQPILVGGTGMYLRSLFDGIAAIPPIPAELTRSLEARFDAEGDALHAELGRIDPDYALKIHPHDRQRVTRALSVWLATGRTFTSWHKETPPPEDRKVLRYALGLTLVELEPSLKHRIDRMIKAGAIEEAARARTVCDDPSAPGWSGIGCAELHAHLSGRLGLAEAKALWLKNTRAYAKRQLTWFRADRRIRWYRPEHTGDLVARALSDLGGTASGTSSG